ncbi:MAG: sensor histidine kinase [Lysobacter sp.]
MDHRTTPFGRFWLINIVPWGLYGGLMLFLSQVFGGGLHSGMVLLSVLLAVEMWAITGAIRALAGQLDWWRLGAPALTLRLLLAVVVGATAAQLALALVLIPAVSHGWVSLPGGHADYRPAAVLGYWINTCIVLMLWVGLWVGLHSLRHARRSELARLRAEAARTALERDALRARLNPHFVFNALNNLRALINEEPARAREMVTRLSNTLRHALEHSRDERVGLAEEIRVVEDYLAIEAVHYEERMRVEWQVAPAALSATLPAMALQLLVENAIKHGIAVVPGGGEVGIRATLEGAMLRLEVRNPVPQAAGSEGHGIGLAYLRTQLGIPAGGEDSSQGRFTLQRRGDTVHAVLEIHQ